MMMPCFAAKLDKFRNDLKVRRLIRKLYSAKDNLDKAFAEIDEVNREIKRYHK